MRFVLKDDPCQLYFVYLICDDKEHLLSQSSFGKHELEIAGQTADFLKVPLDDNTDKGETWPAL